MYDPCPPPFSPPSPPLTQTRSKTGSFIRQEMDLGLGIVLFCALSSAVCVCVCVCVQLAARQHRRHQQQRDDRYREEREREGGGQGGLLLSHRMCPDDGCQHFRDWYPFKIWAWQVAPPGRVSGYRCPSHTHKRTHTHTHRHTHTEEARKFLPGLTSLPSSR